MPAQPHPVRDRFVVFEDAGVGFYVYDVKAERPVNLLWREREGAEKWVAAIALAFNELGMRAPRRAKMKT